jgi:hypothetical protein
MVDTKNELKITLNPVFKAFRIDLLQSSVSIETLEELNTIFLWLKNHLEIHIVLLSNSSQSLLKPLFTDEKNHFKYKEKLDTLITSIQNIPQIFITDSGLGLKNYLIEIFFSGDIKIAHKKSSFEFTYLQDRLIPKYSTLLKYLPFSYLKETLFLNETLKTSSLKNFSIFSNLYEGTAEDLLNNYFKKLSSQERFAIIQTKHFFCNFNVENTENFEKLIANSMKFSVNESTQSPLPLYKIKENIQFTVFQGGKKT